MKRVAFLAILGAFTFVGCSSETLSAVVAPSIDTISADELKQLVESGQEFIFVDVRTAEEIEKNGTLSNYIHIPLQELNARLSEVPKGKPVVTACELGVRAGRAAVALEKAGYHDIRSAGLTEYRAKGYPLIYPKHGH